MNDSAGVGQIKKVSRKLRKCNAWPPGHGSQEAQLQQAAADRLQASQRAVKVRSGLSTQTAGSMDGLAGEHQWDSGAAGRYSGVRAGVTGWWKVTLLLLRAARRKPLSVQSRPGPWPAVAVVVALVHAVATAPRTAVHKPLAVRLSSHAGSARDGPHAVQQC